MPFVNWAEGYQAGAAALRCVQEVAEGTDMDSRHGVAAGELLLFVTDGLTCPAPQESSGIGGLGTVAIRWQSQHQNMKKRTGLSGRWGSL